MVFKPVTAHVLQKFLEARNFGDGAGAKGIKFIVRQLSFANIGTNGAVGICGGDAAISQQPGGRATLERVLPRIGAVAILMSGRKLLAQLPQ